MIILLCSVVFWDQLLFLSAYIRCSACWQKKYGYVAVTSCQRWYEVIYQKNKHSKRHKEHSILAKPNKPLQYVLGWKRNKQAISSIFLIIKKEAGNRDGLASFTIYQNNAVSVLLKSGKAHSVHHYTLPQV